MSSWTLKSIPPHDWFLCLDIESYFDHEHEPEKIFEEGFTRPVPIGETDAIVTVFFNGDPENPEFHIESQESLSKQEITEANKSLTKIFGTDMDLRPLYDQAENDPVLGDKLTDLYGLKRMTRANLFEDILYRIVQMQMNHKPTAKKMMYKIRETYGTALMLGKKSLPAWPRPHQLMKADPANIRKLGPTLRKGQYLVGLANDIVAGEVDMEHLSTCDPQTCYDELTSIKGIGPTSGQDLMMMRGRTDAVFPSNKKSGEEKGLRRWIIWSYGEDPHNTSEERFQELIQNWKGYEASALEFLYANYILKEKEEQAKK
ncbi:DNA-3-methyladenine glycosylase family protein [Gracilimonas sp. BCB1]|uniref:DNA-3-methyladenine glycosylase family protein n=1 Tax=Gracilimonas sp. BCB1 TaxID=3152362 RepID=UPI0032D8F5D7